MASEKVDFDARFDATVADLDVGKLSASLAELRAKETAREDALRAQAATAPLTERPTARMPRNTLADPFGGSFEAAEHTVVLDSKQHAELMALRAQQDA